MFKLMLIVLFFSPCLVLSKVDPVSMAQRILIPAAIKKALIELETVVITVENIFGEKICYQADLGCIYRDKGPLKHTKSLPFTEARLATQFLLYKPGSSKPAILDYNTPSTWTAFPQNSKLIFVIHGFAQDSKDLDLNRLKDSLLSKTQIPVVYVNWKNGAILPAYIHAVANTQIVGRQVALLVDKLVKNRGLKPANVHLIGFSLGGQVAGFAGKWARERFNTTLGRISGLDSASPLYEEYPGSYLTRDDATFVDAIHTTVGNLIIYGNGVGFTKPYAHVDFYPNGGNNHPMCKKLSFNPIEMIAGLINVTCNHFAAINLMDASIAAANKCQFDAVKCTSFDDYKAGKCANMVSDSRMGYFSVNTPGRGSPYYLINTKDYPYC